MITLCIMASGDFVLTESAGVQKEEEEKGGVTTGSTIPPQRWRHNRHQGNKPKRVLKGLGFVVDVEKLTELSF